LKKYFNIFFVYQLVISNNDIASESPSRVASSPGTLSAAELTGNGHFKNELIIDQRWL